ICTNSSVVVTPTNGFVEGNLRKPINTGSPVVNFEVGTGTTYSPLNISFSGVTGAGNFTVSAIANDHPDILGSNIEPNRSVNRHWSITNNSVTFTSLNAVFNFTTSDRDPLADFSNFSVRRYDGLNWGIATVGTRTSTSTQITGEAAANLPSGQIRYYQIGELIPTTGVFNRLTGTQNWSNPATWIQNRTGAVQFTVGSNLVTGTGTLFTTELSPGDVLMLQTSPGTIRGTVQSITDNTTLTLTANATATVSGGYGRQYVPNTINDQVTIGNSNITPDAATTINLDMNATVNSLDINTLTSPRSTAQVLTHSGTNTLTVQTNVRVNQPASAASATDVWNINAGTATVGGNVVIGSGTNSATALARINITTGTLNVGSNLVFNTSNNANRELTAVLDMTGGNGRINLSGQLSFTNSRGLLLSGTAGSVFNYNRTSGGQTVMFPTANSTPWTYHNLHLNNTSGSGINLFGGITASNVTGDVRVQSGIFYVGNAPITGNPGRTFQVAPGATFRMEGNQPFPTGFGTFDLGTSSPFGTVIYQQSNDQNIANHTYGNLILRRTGRTYSIPNVNLNVAGSLTLGDGSATVTLQDEPGGGASNLTVAGDLTITSGARLRADNNDGISTITVGGNWVNNSTAGPSVGFDEGTGTVIFNSPPANTLQTIGGTTAETFYNLTLNTSAATDVVRILNNTNVSNQLNLVQGELDLNSLTLYVTNPATGAVTRTSGYVKSEDNSSPYGTLRRQTGTATGSFLFPFGKSSTEYIPFTMNITSAGSPATGSVSVSTYPTGTDNTPYPDGVTNLNGTSGGTSVADRFWVITLNNYTGTRPTSTMTFTATAAEIATTGATTLNAQRWAPSNTWEPALPGQTYNPSAGTVTVPNVSQYSPWAIADISSPLPVELKSFELVTHADFVEVKWTTASELNNDYFTVERKFEDGEQFEPLASIPGAGTTNTERTYRYEDYSISPGTWYYRIKQTDFDGSYSYSAVKSVKVSGKGLWQVYPNPSDGEVLNIRFTVTDLNKNAVVSIIDTQGKSVHLERVVIRGLDVPVRPAQKLPAGVYLVIIRTSDDVVQQKWIVR
ncbi:MAG: T9SS type A sorting domain-containing protein, partial [Cyclobacteriaceae bacterium]|nr:T9SS type A sorting domain-containing protein [Cyclobacteriaceae bacterium]